jgi:hypothetical protein
MYLSSFQVLLTLTLLIASRMQFDAFLHIAQPETTFLDCILYHSDINVARLK